LAVTPGSKDAGSPIRDRHEPAERFNVFEQGPADASKLGHDPVILE